MKKTSLILGMAALCSSAIVLESCKKEGCTDKVATNYDEKANTEDGSCEYVMGCTDESSLTYNADATKDDGSCRSFIGWDSWVLEATKQGPSPSLGPAHSGNDSTVVRKIYFREGQDPVDGKYPEGTMILKHTSNEDGSLVEYTGMLKRAEGFNPDHHDWEWFILNADGSVAKDGQGVELRGANLLNGYCSGCHHEAHDSDHVFSK